MVLPKHFDYFLVCEFVMRLISVSKLEVVLEFNLMHFLLHFFAALEGILELFAHSFAHLLLSPQLFLGDLNYRIEIYLYPILEN